MVVSLIRCECWGDWVTVTSLQVSDVKPGARHSRRDIIPRVYRIVGLEGVFVRKQTLRYVQLQIIPVCLELTRLNGIGLVVIKEHPSIRERRIFQRQCL